MAAVQVLLHSIHGSQKDLLREENLRELLLPLWRGPGLCRQGIDDSRGRQGGDYVGVIRGPYQRRERLCS
eukprot:XP_001705327.1 Hypothetical protein GL50803_86406 [Giardia lamblia ATCC 50803]